MPLKLKAVLFDIDDTLFDREASQVISLERMLERYPTLFAGFNRQTLWQAWMQSDRLSDQEFNAGSFDRASRCRHFLRLLNLPSAQADDLTRLYLKEYPSINAPLEGALPLILELSRQLKVGVISNSNPDVQYGKIETLGLTGFLSCIVLSEELGIRKPDPRVFHHAAGLLQIQSSDCLFVGDSFSPDIVGAKTAGMLACWLRRRETPPPADPGIQPDFSIKALTELLPLLTQNGLFP